MGINHQGESIKGAHSIDARCANASLAILCVP